MFKNWGKSRGRKERDENRKWVEREMENKKRQKEEEDRVRRIQQEQERIEMSLNQQELERRRGEIMDKTELSSTKMDFNMGQMGLVDRIECHPAGTFMKNVVISNKPPPDRELNLARLRTYKAQTDMSKMTLGDIQPFDLSSEYTEFPLTQAMTETQFKSLKRYCLISDIFIHYIPLDTFFAVSSPVNFFINDFRKIEDTTVREYPLTHSGGYNLLFSLDYCVRTSDLHCLSLSISTGLSSFRKNIAWASVKIVITLTHMDFPIKANIQETMGVLHLADSDLQDFISDPRGSDGVITPEAIRLLKEAYRRGDIENINKSKDDTKTINQAKTEFRHQDADQSVGDLMRSMRSKHLDEERKRNRESMVMVKSSLKKKDAEMSGGLIVSQDQLANMTEEVEPLDSVSNYSEEDTVEMPARAATPPVSRKNISFGLG